MVSYFEVPKIDPMICDFELCDSPAVIQWFHINVNSDVTLSGRLVYYEGLYYAQAYNLLIGEQWPDCEFTSDNVQKATDRHKKLLDDFSAALNLVKDLQEDGEYISIAAFDSWPGKQQIIDALYTTIKELLR
jgi:hypothetical protein